MALKSIVLNPGECIVLPAGAEITSVLVNGAASITSTCGELPPIENYKCGYFFLYMDATTGNTHSMDSDSLYSSIKVGDTTSILNELITHTDTDNPIPCSSAQLNLHLTDLAIFQFMSVNWLEADDRIAIKLYFQAPESLWDTIELKIDNRGVGNYMYLRPQEETECGVFTNPT